MKAENCDFLVVGGGIIGISIALELRREFPNADIMLIEKEQALASHASGRNSGVLHAGFYYTPDSLKAKLTRDGNELLQDYCRRKNLNLNVCGKVVVTKDSKEHESLLRLYEQGLKNGVLLELVNNKELYRIEPMAKSSELSLWSPNTAIADPIQVAGSLEADLINGNIRVIRGRKIESIDGDLALSSNGEVIKFGHLINAAGLYADRIAKLMGFGRRYTMLPFIGLYYYAPKLSGTLKSHIYPVPDARNPFLGVHLTRTVQGKVKLGPTAIPILSREQYGFLKNLRMNEFIQIASVYPKFFSSKHHDVVSLLATEIPKLSRAHLLKKAAHLSDRIDIQEFTERGKPGIRAQLFDTLEKKLVMDFVVEGDRHSTHVLNAVSPGWTTCFSFAAYITQRIKDRMSL